MEKQGGWGYQGMVILVLYGHHSRPLPITKQRSSELSGGLFLNDPYSALLPFDIPNVSLAISAQQG
jgi:hypothetical protein